MAKKSIQGMLDMIRSKKEREFADLQINNTPIPDKSGVEAAGPKGASATPKNGDPVGKVKTFDKAAHRQGNDEAQSEAKYFDGGKPVNNNEEILSESSICDCESMKCTAGHKAGGPCSGVPKTKLEAFGHKYKVCAKCLPNHVKDGVAKVIKEEVVNEEDPDLTAMLSGNNPAPKKPKSVFDHVTCDRCGGKGNIPGYEAIHAGVCFKCGGVGVKLTPHGKKDQANWKAARDAHTMMRAGDVKVGYITKMGGESGKWRNVDKVEPRRSQGSSMHTENGVSKMVPYDRDGVAIHYGHTAHHVESDSMVRAMPREKFDSIPKASSFVTPKKERKVKPTNEEVDDTRNCKHCDEQIVGPGNKATVEQRNEKLAEHETLCEKVSPNDPLESNEVVKCADCNKQSVYRDWFKEKNTKNGGAGFCPECKAGLFAVKRLSEENLIEAKKNPFKKKDDGDDDSDDKKKGKKGKKGKNDKKENWFDKLKKKPKGKKKHVKEETILDALKTSVSDKIDVELEFSDGKTELVSPEIAARFLKFFGETEDVPRFVIADALLEGTQFGLHRAMRLVETRGPIEGHSYHKKTDAELHYIIKDAGEAAHNMQDMDPKAEGKYLDQVNDASTVLHHRKGGGNRICRVGDCQKPVAGASSHCANHLADAAAGNELH